MDELIDDCTEVTRRVDLDLSAEELWALVGDADGWADWLVDAAEVELAEGRTGRVVVDGEERLVTVGPIEIGVGVRFEWWPSESPTDRSIVELVVSPSEYGSRLDIRERFAGSPGTATAAADRHEAAVQWELRIVLLWVKATLGAPVPR